MGWCPRDMAEWSEEIGVCYMLQRSGKLGCPKDMAVVR